MRPRPPPQGREGASGRKIVKPTPRAQRGILCTEYGFSPMVKHGNYPVPAKKCGAVIWFSEFGIR